MSFLGCTGYIMDGSGIKDGICTIYDLSSVDKMVDGHAFARNISGYTLLHLALSMVIFKDMEIESDALDTFIEQITIRNISYVHSSIEG